MQGTIAFDGTLSGSIAGGGGGGSEVTITPVLTEGEKIAEYSIDGENGELYAPESGSIVTITPTYIDGEKIADFTINGVAGKIYQPEIFYIHKIEKEYIENPGDTLLFYYTESDGDRAAIYCPAAQAPLTAGANITIDQDNVISASGGGVINYSTAEQDTGELWTDGTSHVYQKSFQATLSGNAVQIDLSGLNISKAWIKDGFYDIGNTCLSLNEFIGGSAYCYTHINQGLNPPYIDCFNSISANSTIDITIKYIKNV